MLDPQMDYTAIVVALVAGIFTITTLVIQTYGQIQIARIKDSQQQLILAGNDRTKKIDEQSVKLQEVHTVVNSGHSALIKRVEELTAEVGLLRGVSQERQKNDDAIKDRLISAGDAMRNSNQPDQAPVTGVVVLPSDA